MTTSEAMGVSLLCAGTGAHEAPLTEMRPPNVPATFARIGVVVEREDCANVLAEKVDRQFNVATQVHRCSGGVGYNIWLRTIDRGGQDLERGEVFWFAVGVVSGMGLRWGGE